jgi:hypothetical protein
VIAPRIIPRDGVIGSLRHEQATDPRETCRRTITLDGTTYRCARKTTSGHGVDRSHDGIHDAFCEHGGGAVRW